VGSMNDYNRHYVRPGAQVSGTDIKTYDVGNFSLILSGVSVTSLLGELYVEYSVDFYDPRVAVPIGQNLPMAHIATLAAGSATDAAPLFGATTRVGSNISNLSFTNTTVTIPAVGRYLLTMGVVSTAITASPTITLGANTAAAVIQNVNIASQNTGFVLNTRGCGEITFDVTAPNGAVALTAGAGVIGGQVDVFICQLSSGLTKPRDQKQERLDRMLEKFEKTELCDMFTGKVMGYQWNEKSSSDQKDIKQGWEKASAQKRERSSKVDSDESAMYLRVDENGEVYESPKKRCSEPSRDAKAGESKVIPSSKGQTVPTTLSRS